MTREESGQNSVPETAADASSHTATVGGLFGALEPLWIALLVLGLAGALLTIVADFATLRSVEVLTASCGDLADPGLRTSCVTHGGEEHSYALVLIGVVAIAMTWGATLGRSRPAAAALAFLGGAVLAIALLTDVPDIHKTGVLGERFERARASAGPGLWLELAGGSLLFVTGIVATVAQPGRSWRTRRERERRRRRRAAGAADA
jgi:hypothetical protein